MSDRLACGPKVESERGEVDVVEECDEPRFSRNARRVSLDLSRRLIRDFYVPFKNTSSALRGYRTKAKRISEKLDSTRRKKM